MTRKITLIFTAALILLLLGVGSGIVKVKSLSLPKYVSGPTVGSLPSLNSKNVQVVSEESVTIDVVKKVTPAVVTVGITTTQSSLRMPGFDFGPFGNFFQMPPQQGTQQIKQDIGSGFIVQSNGLIITNKHVVSDTQAKYRVITADNKSFDVQKIYRDPNNDLAFLQINAQNLPTVELGDSSKLQVGQFAIAIGTALGEFRSTVTTGVISGIGRSIEAGTPFTGSEQLSNIIQTSAAINPGNSGGPLLNSAGQVVGVDVAVAQSAQNIGFALPINIVKDSLNTFQSNGGQFASRAFLGIEYQMVSQNLSILNDIPEGAYVSNVVTDSPADKAGIQQGDIITKIDSQPIRDTTGGLSAIIGKKKVGDTVSLEVYRDSSQILTLKATLVQSQQ